MEQDLGLMVANAEHERALEVLDQVDPIRALSGHRRRHDAIWSATERASGATLACRRGCSFCCHFRVGLRADEAFDLVDHARANLPPATLALVQARAAANAVHLQVLSPDRRLRTNLACPFLQEGACAVYPARPHACRSFHATEVDGCQSSYEDPERSDIGQAFVDALADVSAGHDEGLETALNERGFDVAAYEMNAALTEALASDAPRRRYLAGEAAFLAAGFDQPAVIAF